MIEQNNESSRRDWGFSKKEVMEELYLLAQEMKVEGLLEEKKTLVSTIEVVATPFQYVSKVQEMMKKDFNPVLRLGLALRILSNTGMINFIQDPETNSEKILLYLPFKKKKTLQHELRHLIDYLQGTLTFDATLKTAVDVMNFSASSSVIIIGGMILGFAGEVSSQVLRFPEQVDLDPIFFLNNCLFVMFISTAVSGLVVMKSDAEQFAIHGKNERSKHDDNEKNEEISS